MDEQENRFAKVNLEQPSLDVQISRFRKTLLENIKDFCEDQKLSLEKTTVAELLESLKKT